MNLLNLNPNSLLVTRQMTLCHQGLMGENLVPRMHEGSEHGQQSSEISVVENRKSGRLPRPLSRKYQIL